ncbi:hypothetical protein Tco_0810629 [Tanacetum coccineum]
MQMQMWMFKRCGTFETFLVEYMVLRDLILHHSLINNSASLSNKFGESYFIFKFGISGLLQQVVTAIADRIRDNGTSQSKQKFQSSLRKFITFQDLCFRHELLEYIDVHNNDASENSKPSWGKMCTLLLPGKLIQFMHTTMVPEQVKTMKTQAGVQVSRPGELKRHLQLRKCFGRHYFIVIVLDGNIVNFQGEVVYTTLLSMVCEVFYIQQVNTMKIQARVQVSRAEDLKRHLQLWKRFGRLYFVVFVLVRSNHRLGCHVDSGLDQPDAESGEYLHITLMRVAGNKIIESD